MEVSEPLCKAYELTFFSQISLSRLRAMMISSNFQAFFEYYPAVRQTINV